MAAEETTEPSLEDRAGQQARNGWGPIPLPTRKKAQPPTGFTGDKHPAPSYADWWTIYADEPDRWGNLGARIPMRCVGVDVDAYNGKNGAATWAALDGTTWPATVVLSSRFGPGYDGTSGIRFYRLPDGIEQHDLWGAHDGIEILRFGHRYAVSPGSDHPEGGVYRLVDMRTKQFLDVLPHVDDLPELTIEQATLLTQAGAPWAGQASSTDRAPDAAPMCRRGLQILNRGIHKLSTESSRFDTMRDTTWALVSAEDEGHHIGIALDTLKLAYIAVAAKDRRDQGAEPPGSEFDRAVAGARAKVDANPCDEMLKGCCVTDVDLEAPEPAPQPGDDTQAEPEPLTAYDRAVRAKYAELRVLDDARGMLASHRTGDAPSLDPITLHEFLNQPDEDAHYRVGDLWPAEGRVLLAAAAKSGKTTMVAANLIPSLVDGREFLGRYPATPVTGQVVYLNMEVGERTLRRWMREAGIVNAHKVHVLNLRGKSSALTLASEAGRASLAGQLRDLDAEVVILDPLAPVLASLGLDENSNADVARFFAWWSDALTQAGVVDDLVVHHTGHAGQRSRGASRLLDEPDAIWTLTKADSGEDEDELDEMFGDGPTRFLQAYGRDVDLAAEGIEYDPQTHGLALNGQAKGKANGKKIERAIIKAMADGQPRSKNAIIKEVGGKRENAYAAIERLLGTGELVDLGERSRNGYPLLVIGTA